MALQKAWCGHGCEISPAAECSSSPYGVALASAELTYGIVVFLLLGIRTEHSSYLVLPYSK